MTTRLQTASNLLQRIIVRSGQIGVSPWPNFFSAMGAVLDADAGDLVIRLKLNGASSKSICGGS